LDVVLSTKRVDAGAGLPEVPSDQREVDLVLHVVDAAGVLAHPHPGEDGGVVRHRVLLGGEFDVFEGDAGLLRGRLLVEVFEGLFQVIEPLGALVDERLVDPARVRLFLVAFRIVFKTMLSRGISAPGFT